jgi:hypothetical protein
VADIITDVLNHMLRPRPRLDARQCIACGFFLHSNGEHSMICPVLVKGSLHQFQLKEGGE